MADSNPVGRPTVMTPEVIGKLTAAFALDARVEAACAYAGISKQTYYNYLDTKPEFLDEVEGLRQTPYLQAVQSVVKKLDDPDFALKYLERKAKNEFSQRTELTGRDGDPLRGEMTVDISPSLAKALEDYHARHIKPTDSGGDVSGPDGN